MAYYRGVSGAMSEEEYQLALTQEYERVQQHFEHVGHAYGPYAFLGRENPMKK
jgi:hypothetical protein